MPKPIQPREDLGTSFEYGVERDPDCFFLSLAGLDPMVDQLTG
jgi:hypothetical protein